MLCLYHTLLGYRRHRLELMRTVYNEDLSPDTPEAKQDIFHCLSACGQQNVFSFRNLLPNRSACFRLGRVCVHVVRFLDVGQSFCGLVLTVVS